MSKVGIKLGICRRSRSSDSIIPGIGSGLFSLAFLARAMSTHSTLFLVFLVAVMAITVSGDYKVPTDLFDSPHSKKLNRKEFLESITDGNVHVVEFYSDGCRGCQKFAGDWKAIAEKFKDTEGVEIAQINCSIEGRLCRQRAVNGYPTIKVFQNGEEYITYEGIMFGELVEKFIASVARDLLQETTT